MIGAESVGTDPLKTRLVLEYKHNRPLTSCHWSPAGRFIFFGAEDFQVHRFDSVEQSAVSLTAHDSWIRSLGSSPDGEILYSGGYDGRLIWWPASAAAPEPIRIVEAHRGWIRALSVSPDGRLIATCGNDRMVRLWDAASGVLVRESAGHAAHVYHAAFSPDSQSLLSCDLMGIVLGWAVDSGSRRDVLTVEALHGYDTTFRADIGGARCMAFRGDGVQLALGGIINVTNAFAGTGEIGIALVDPTQSRLDLLLESKEKTHGTVWGVAHHPDGYWIGLSGGGGGWLHFWKGDASHQFFHLQLKSDGRGMSVAPDQTQLAVAHADMHLRTYAMSESAS